jgi:hypothetical protein
MDVLSRSPDEEFTVLKRGFDDGNAINDGAEFDMTANTSSLTGTIFATIAALLAGADCTSGAERVATADSSYCLQNPCPPDSTVRDLQDHGPRIAQSDHQTGDDRDLASGALPHPGRPLVLSEDRTSRYVPLIINKSIALEFSRDVKDVFIANPGIADAVVLSSRRAYVIAKKLGQTNVYFYDAQGRQIEGLNLSIGEDHEIQEVTPEQLVTVVEGPGQGQGEKGAKITTYTCPHGTTFCRQAEYAKTEKPPQPINVFPSVTSISAAAAATTK